MRFPQKISGIPLRIILRSTIAMGVMYCGFSIGKDYVHLCKAGSRFIELFALLGAPLLSAILVLILRYHLGLPLALLLIVISYALRQPYLDLVHGPNNPWPMSLSKK